MLALFFSVFATFQPVSATRADLALAYLRFEQVFEEANITDTEQLKTISREFDSLTFAFFTGRYADAVRSMNQITSRISGDPDFDLLARYKVMLYPRTITHSSAQNITISVSPLYGDKDTDLALSVIDSTYKTVLNKKFEWDKNERGVVIVENKIFREGVYNVQLNLKGKKVDATKFFVFEKPILEIKKELLNLIDTVPENVKMQWKDIIKSRINLLTDDPSETNSAQFLANPIELAKSLKSELQSLKKDENPFKNFTGDFWINIELERSVPMRIFCANKTNKPKPVIIALHGAGGDENMFMDAYGNGMIKKLAEKHDAIVVSPRTELFTSQAQSVSLLLNFLKSCHKIDEKRIFVLGHSMGAGGAATLLDRNENLLSACVMIAGGRALTKKHENTRILFVAGELDPIFNVNNLRRQAESTKNAGNKATIKTYPEHGHTLVVNASLSEVFRFFFEEK
jgi:predicted esterase